MSSVDFRWRYQDADGRELAGPEVRFAAQVEAESWFGEQWPDLLAQVYGPMSLHPADS
jgi:hypothetical protein